MDIPAIIIGLAILAAIAFYVSRPLIRPKREVQAAGMDTFSLEARRDSLYTQIKELDLDHATGKVNDEDYTRLRADLVAQAADVLKQIDGVVQRPSEVPVTKPIAPLAVDDDIEALIAARRKTRSVSVPQPAAAPKGSDVDIEAAIAARRKTKAPVIESTTLTCPKCGRPVNADDAFCAKCGTALQPQAAP